MTLARRESRVLESPLARWDTRWKLAAILFAVIGTATLHQLLPAAIAVVAAIGLTQLARLPTQRVLSRLGLIALGLLPFLLLMPFAISPLNEGWIRFNDDGLLSALTVGCRGLAIGTLGLVLISTAPLARTISAAHSLKLPGVLVQVTHLAYRYTFVLAEEVRRLRTAMRTRGFRIRVNAHTHRTLATAAGAVLVRGGERAERVAAAMRCRGFDGIYRHLTPHHTTTADVLGFLALVAFTALLVSWDRFG